MIMLIFRVLSLSLRATHVTFQRCSYEEKACGATIFLLVRLQVKAEGNDDLIFIAALT
jgi:hypothetical protein